MNNMLSGLSFITSLLTPSKQQKQSPAVINAARNLAVVKCGGQLFHQPNDLVTSASAFSSPSASKNSSDDDDSRWTLLFKDSQLSIKPSSMRFHYELVCCKVVEDGEEDEDDDDDELSFLLHPDLLFRSNSLSPQFLAYLWTDSAGTHYKWVPTPVNQDNVEEALDDFTYFAHKCMFEALAKTESDNVSLEELNRIAESIQAQAAAIAAETSASLRSRYTSSSSTPVKGKLVCFITSISSLTRLFLICFQFSNP